jgi:hypothetical protein
MENMVLGRGGTISAANFGFSRVDKRKEQDFQGFCSASVAESFRGCRLEWLHRKPLEKLIDELCQRGPKALFVSVFGGLSMHSFSYIRKLETLKVESP